METDRYGGIKHNDADERVTLELERKRHHHDVGDRKLSVYDETDGAPVDNMKNCHLGDDSRWSNMLRESIQIGGKISETKIAIT